MVSPQDVVDLQNIKAKRSQAVEWFDAFFAQTEAANITDMRAAAWQLADAEVVRMVKKLQ